MAGRNKTLEQKGVVTIHQARKFGDCDETDIELEAALQKAGREPK